ncbi:HAMP domain-containing sensor histidine kinase [Bacillus massiliigorillae]|uniref:HAMP domain-containing sensor histidine kinase n=1 Tax=Bacillus massiliigorillae TaxID=1243664 RepID=UPI0003A2818E|nr:HAMP domain-containing sensor histidine kinase [Bacillus massiliigorillae]
MKKMKLFPKTFLYVMGLMVLITLIGHVLIYVLMPIFYTNQKEKDFKDINSQLVKQLKKISTEEVQYTIGDFAQEKSIQVYLNYDGVILEANSSNLGPKQSIAGMKIETENKSSISSNVPSDSNDMNFYESNSMPENHFDKTNDFLEMGSKFTNQYGQECYVKTTETLQPVNEAKSIVIMVLPFSLLICLVFSTLFALLYSRKITKPLERISYTTGKMKQLDKMAICEVNTKDEIGILAENVNSLYESLQTTIDNLQRENEHVSRVEQSKVDFMRAASHELKTPVTAVNFMLDNMIIGVGKFKDHETYLPKCKELVEKLSDMVCGVLDASKLSFYEKDESAQDTQIADMVRKSIEPYLLIAKAKGVVVNIELSKGIIAKVPPESFAKVISNVFSNAVNYTLPGERIRLVLGEKSILIENECTPLPAEYLERIFEPFYRPDFSRNRHTGGSGLGLYLVSQILSVYQISYSFLPYEKGMRFTIIF